jgi:hypothetical protein
MSYVCRQFTLCCARLAELCDKGLETSVAEFTAYRLLHALYKKHFHQVTSRYTLSSHRSWNIHRTPLKYHPLP